MSFRVLDVSQEFTDRATGNREIVAEIIADTESDLPANTTALSYILGSYATTVDTGAQYKIDSTGTWHKQPANEWENVYTKTEIDTMLANLPILSRSDLYRGYQIVANTDIDTLTNYGTYYCADGTTAATLSNCPISTTGFIMIIYSTGNRVRLFFGVSATNPRAFIQADTGGTWRTIKEFTLA